MIQLTEELWLRADEHCYQVGTLRPGRGKGPELRDATYYSTAAEAVRGAVERLLRQGVAYGTITTLEQFVREQARQRAALEKALAPLGGGEGARA